MKPLSWSFSSLNQFNTCPKQYHHIRVIRDVKDTPSEESLWGTEVHKALELFVRDGTPMDERFKEFQRVGEIVAGLPGAKFCEQQIALNRHAVQVAWFAKDAWVRAILDVLVLLGPKALVIDYKTGKRKPNSRQLALFALLVFHVYPHIESVDTRFLWLKTNEVDREVYVREQLSSLWEMFMPDVQQLERAYENNHFPAKPSGLCRGWCPVTTCPHWTERREK